MKWQFIFLMTFVALGTACAPCVECNGSRFCKEAGATYTDAQGNTISWEQYAAGIEVNCP